MKTLKFASRYVARHWWQYVLGILALYMVDQVNVYVPEFTGNIIDGLTGAMANPPTAAFTMDDAMRIVWMILGMGAAIAIGRFCWRFFIFGAARSIEREIRQDMYGHLSTLSMRYFNQHKTGDLMAHFTNDLMAVRQLLGMTVITAFDASVMMVLVLYQMIVSVDPRLTAMAIIPLLVICVGDFFYGRIMHKRFREKQAAFSTLSDQVQETISGIRVIKAFVQERRELAAFARTTEAAKEKNLNVVRLHALMMPLMDIIIGASSLITLIYGGYLAIHGEITVGQFVEFNSYVGMLVWPMMAVGECITSISQGTASLDVAGALIQTGYSAAYTCGGISYSLEITLRCSTPAQLELSAALAVLVTGKGREAGELIDALRREGIPARVSELSVGGEDIMALGARGADVGRVLNALLRACVMGEVGNTENELMSLATRLL